MSREKRWRESKIEDGVGQIRFSRWRYFMDYIYQEMLDYKHYIWRGQRCDNWGLETTLDRLIRQAEIAKKTNRTNFRSSHLEQFKYAVRGRRGPNPATIESENEWWALGQHHGLATPLLDWTFSPFAAAYFAFIANKPDQTMHRAIFALSRPSIESKVQKLKNEEDKKREDGKKEADAVNYVLTAYNDLPAKPEIEFIRPKSDENQRLVNQSGLFTRAPDGINLENWVKANYRGDTKTYILMKLLIPNKDRADCLRTLNRMNINHLTLFPDLYGASTFCNLFGEIEKY